MRTRHRVLPAAVVATVCAVAVGGCSSGGGSATSASTTPSSHTSTTYSVKDMYEKARQEKLVTPSTPLPAASTKRTKPGSTVPVGDWVVVPADGLDAAGTKHTVSLAVRVTKVDRGDLAKDYPGVNLSQVTKDGPVTPFYLHLEYATIAGKGFAITPSSTVGLQLADGSEGSTILLTSNGVGTTPEVPCQTIFPPDRSVQQIGDVYADCTIAGAKPGVAAKAVTIQGSDYDVDPVLVTVG